MHKDNNIAVIDLFCGIGGLSHGFVMENFNVISGYDNDVSCKYIYETNNSAIFHIEDVNQLDGEKINQEFGSKLKILVGCAPCQPFSSYSFKVKKKDEKKLNLLYSFARLIEEVHPTVVSMENVPQLIDTQIFKDFYNKLEELGYKISYQVVFCPDYGIPQRRRRLVLLASKLGEIFLIPKTHTPENYVTVKDTIEQLMPVKAGEYDKNDPLHRARKLSDLNLKRIRNTKEGGGWKNWSQDLVLDCFKKSSGKSYVSVYGRMKWNEPAPTMTTHCTGLGNGRFGHPEQDRAITLREAALFQTFPMEYKFFETLYSFHPSIICRQIGNAVPPKLGKVIAHSIKEHLIQYNLWQNQ
jgi:DNA (cytosine-5)-methyltransferase 1